MISSRVLRASPDTQF